MLLISVFTPAYPGHLPLCTPARCSYPCGLTPVRGQLGALRLKVRLIEDRILPSHNYRPLTELLTEAVRGPAEVGASVPPGPGTKASPCFGDPYLGSFALGALGHLSCLLSLPRRMPLVPWPCWRS